MAGSDELEKGKFLLKNMHTGEQMMIEPDRLENYLEI
jgi:histidyl-tRNA synthetase